MAESGDTGVLDRIKRHPMISFAGTFIALFVLLGQFTGALKATGILCKTPVQWSVECYRYWSGCRGLTEDQCRQIMQDFGETQSCSNGCA